MLFISILFPDLCNKLTKIKDIMKFEYNLRWIVGYSTISSTLYF